MRKTLGRILAALTATALIALIVLGGVPAPLVQAQEAVAADVGGYLFRFAEPVNYVNAGDASSTTGDNDTALLIKYVGSSTTNATLTVAATTGDITFKTGPVSGSTADLTLECPVSGDLGGIIDVSNAACDTIGEVVDIINGSPNWRAVALDSLASDVIDASNDGSGSLLDFSETLANIKGGVQIKWNVNGDASAFNLTRALLTPEQRVIEYYYEARSKTLYAEPFAGQRTIVQRFDVQADMDSGSAAPEFFSVNPSVLPIAAEASTFDYSEVSTTLYTGPVVASDTAYVINPPYGIFGRRGEKLVVRFNATADIDAFTISAFGFQVKVQ